MTVFNSRLLDHGLCENNPGNQPRRAACCPMKPKTRYPIILTTIDGKWSQIKQKAFQKCAVTPTHTLSRVRSTRVFGLLVLEYFWCISVKLEHNLQMGREKGKLIGVEQILRCLSTSLNLGQ